MGLQKATLSILIFFAASMCHVDSQKHVVFMHGIFAGPDGWDHFGDLVKKNVPGVPVTKVDAFDNTESLINPMWKQVTNISLMLKPILTNASSETVLVCYSQGGLICRGLLSLLQHNVGTCVILSSPLSGQFGDTSYMRFLFPHMLKENAYKIFYSNYGQDFSVGNYWNDPHQQTLYKKYSNFLAVLNNESDTVNTFSQQYKQNFLKLKKLVLVGGPDDGVITPWQASHFGTYNSSEIVQPMTEQQWYKNDAFGLRTLNERKAIAIETVPGVQHLKWHTRDDIFNKFILPYLK